MGHYASEMYWGPEVERTCITCGATAMCDELRGSVHLGNGECIRYLRKKIEDLESTVEALVKLVQS